MEPVIEAWRYGQLMAEHVTQFSLDIKKISGQDVDKYRTWKMTQFIPEIPDYLNAYKIILQHINTFIRVIPIQKIRFSENFQGIDKGKNQNKE